MNNNMKDLEYITDKVGNMKDITLMQSVTISKEEYAKLLNYKKKYLIIKDFLDNVN